jgi:hypothetical protein
MVTTQGDLKRYGALQNTVTVGATTTLSTDIHGGKLILLNSASTAVTLTLPVATGSGIVYRIMLLTANSGGTTIKVPNSTHVFRGRITMYTDNSNAALGWPNASSSDTITLNATTTGGATSGDYLEIVDVSANTYLVRNAVVNATGTEETPWSATV